MLAVFHRLLPVGSKFYHTPTTSRPWQLLRSFLHIYCSLLMDVDSLSPTQRDALVLAQLQTLTNSGDTEVAIAVLSSDVQVRM